MIRIILKTCPTPYVGMDDKTSYTSFDVVNAALEAALKEQIVGAKRLILGYEFRPDPPAPKPVEVKPKDGAPAPTGNSLQDKLATYKYERAKRLQTEGTLPAALNDKETLIERLARFDAAEKAKRDKEAKEKSEKEAKERKERLKAAQMDYDSQSWLYRMRHERPSKANGGAAG